MTNTATNIPPFRGELKHTVRLSGPFALTLLSTMAISVTDVVMSGWLGPRFLAAETLASNLVFPAYFFAVGLAAGLAPMVAQDLAQNNSASANHTFRQGVWALLIVSIPIMIVMALAEPILLLFQQDPTLVPLSAQYLSIILWGMPGTMIFLAFRNYMGGRENPRSPMVIMLIAIIVNACLNYILMFGKFGFPRLELVGLGISTLLVSWFTAVAALVYIKFAPHLRPDALLKGIFRFDWARLKEIYVIGLPIGGTMLAEALAFAILVLAIGLFGPLQLAAYGIAVQYIAISYMFFTGVSQAATVRVAHFVGRGVPGGSRQAGKAAAIIGIILSLPWAYVFLFHGHDLGRLFLTKNDPESLKTLEYTVSFLLIAAIFQIIDAAQVIAIGALRGMKDTKVPFILTLVCHWGVSFPMALVLGFWADLQGPGIWLGFAVGLCLIAIIASHRFYRKTNVHAI